MPGVHPSYGVFTSPTAVKTASSKDIERMFFTTTNRTAFSKKSVQMSPRGRAESVKEIHNIGKTGTKWMPHQYKTAPLLAKDSCQYHRDFVTKPSMKIGDHDLAEFFKGSRFQSASAPLLEKRSHHRMNYQSPTTEELVKAAEPVVDHIPGRTHTTGNMDFSLEKQTLSNFVHRAHPRLAPRIAAVPPLPSLFVSGDCGDCYRTTYTNDFPRGQGASPLKFGRKAEVAKPRSFA